MRWNFWRRLRGGAARTVAGRSARARRSRFAPTLIAALAALLVVTAAFGARYTYDASGRLVGASNDLGESARYVYDDMGNLLAVERLGVGDLAIFSFNPLRGSPGVQVRLNGHGFATDPAGNGVSFNGVPATVQESSGHELVVTVPAGATTGPITVTVGAKTAVSATDFVIDPSLQPPVIHDVSPLVAVAGTQITAAGSGFNPVPGQTTVRLGARPVSVDTLTNNQTAFAVPENAGSGPVSVATPFGNAKSAQDVLVVPPGIDPALVVQVKRVTPDSPAEAFQTLNDGEYVAALIEGAVGEYLTAQWSNLPASGLHYYLYDPANRSIVHGAYADPNYPSFLFPRLSSAGTYLLLMKPISGPASWNLAIERATPILADGESVAIEASVPRQKRQFTFHAVAGQTLGLGLSDITVADGGYVTVSAWRPDGVQVHGAYCYAHIGTCDLNLPIALTGNYQVVVEPYGATTWDVAATLSKDASALLVRDTPQALALSRWGQNARLEFAGSAGEAVTLQMTGQQAAPSGGYVYYTLYQPDGAYLTSLWALADETLNVPKLPADGRYTLFVDPAHGARLEVHLLLANSPVVDLEIDGAVQEHATTLPGQELYFSFDASAGQSLGLGISDLWTTGDATVYVEARNPDGQSIGGTYCRPWTGGCGLNLSITTTGEHRLAVMPMGMNTMALRATLSEDVSLALDMSAPLQLTLPRKGQNATLTFTGTAGEPLTVQVTAQQTDPAGQHVYYSVYQPDGTFLSSASAIAGGVLNLRELPESGQYTLFVDPSIGAAMDAQVLLVGGLRGEMEVGGPEHEYESLVHGQDLHLTFEATAGEKLGLGISDLWVTDGGFVFVDVWGPDGRWVQGKYCNEAMGGCDLNLSIAVTGTHRIVAEPYGMNAMGFKAVLSIDATAVLVRDVPQPLLLPNRGQNAWFTFSATAGEAVVLQVGEQQTTPAEWHATYTIYQPNGTYLSSMGVTGARTLDLADLPETGQYTVFVDPYYGASLQAQVLLASGATGELEVDTSGDHATTVPGQSLYLTFNATAGQSLGLAITDLWMTENSFVYIDVRGPDDGWVQGTSCGVGVDGCDLNLSIASTGAHRIVVTPYGLSTMSFKATLSEDLAGVLVRDVPQDLVLSRRGQNARLTFDGTVGEKITLQVLDQQTLPADQYVYYRIYQPNGTHLSSMWSQVENAQELPELPESGQYTVFVDPSYGALIESQVLLATGATGEMIVDGAISEHGTTVLGQELHLTFDAEAGQTLGFGISDLSVTDDGFVYVNVIGPDGLWVQSTTCAAWLPGCGLNLQITASGTHHVALRPNGMYTMHFKAALSEDVRVSLPRDQPQVLSLPRRGQNGRLTFTAAAGEAVTLQVSGQQTEPAGEHVYYTVYRPDGTHLTSTAVFGEGVMNLTDLPETGQYTVFVDPYYGETFQAQAWLATGATGELEIDGAEEEFATTVGGQEMYLTFHAVAGQNLGVGISDLWTTDDSSIQVLVWPPGGGWAGGATCYMTVGGCGFNFPVTATGTHHIVVTPYGMRPMSFKATLSEDLSRVLARDVPLALSLPRRGQNARLTFSGETGERLTLQVTGQQTTPSGQYAYHTIYRPDGTYLSSMVSSSEGTVALPELPESGQYTVFVDPNYGATLQAEVRQTADP